MHLQAVGAVERDRYTARRGFFSRCFERVFSRASIHRIQIAVCCSVLQCVAAVCYSSVLQGVARCYNRVLQIVAVCCSVLQCLAMYCSVSQNGVT